jgi:hypothetical protein
LLDKLATAAGLLEAIAELPLDSPPVLAMVPRLAKRSRAALAEWYAWQKTHPSTAEA